VSIICADILGYQGQ